MEEEIKEILDDFKIYEDRYKKCNETQFIIFYRDIHLLLDYITNLQEEIERQSKAQVILDNQIAEMCKYKQRNEKAIEYLDKVETLAILDGKIIFSINIFRNILKGDKDE